MRIDGSVPPTTTRTTTDERRLTDDDVIHARAQANRAVFDKVRARGRRTPLTRRGDARECECECECERLVRARVLRVGKQYGGECMGGLTTRGARSRSRMSRLGRR
jgi:hypothetical protein